MNKYSDVELESDDDVMELLLHIAEYMGWDTMPIVFEDQLDETGNPMFKGVVIAEEDVIEDIFGQGSVEHKTLQ